MNCTHEQFLKKFYYLITDVRHDYEIYMEVFKYLHNGSSTCNCKTDLTDDEIAQRG